VHVLNYWKDRFSDYLGFDFKYEISYGIHDQDLFGGNDELCLVAFFSVFTPEKIIELLTDDVNSNYKELYALDIMKEQFITKNLPLAYFDCSEDYPVSINSKYIENYLIESKIIIKNEDEEHHILTK
jgi:hypothetical protein